MVRGLAIFGSSATTTGPHHSIIAYRFIRATFPSQYFSLFQAMVVSTATKSTKNVGKLVLKSNHHEREIKVLQWREGPVSFGRSNLAVFRRDCYWFAFSSRFSYLISVKNVDKVPASKVKKHLDVELEVPVSPNSSSAESLEDEVSALRARNKMLMEALNEVKKSATKAVEKNFDLVWYARNRCKSCRLIPITHLLILNL